MPTPPATGRQEPVSVDSGILPRWRADGAELFFIRSDGTMMAVGVDTGDGISAGIPEPLFRAPCSLGPSTGYFVSNNGLRFLVPAVSEDIDPSAAITVVLNWCAEFQR